MQNLYEVARLDAAGAQQYRLSKRPTACIGPQRCFSNPARDYPINTLAFWWTDTRHPSSTPGCKERSPLPCC
jgi:hypothetical protein